jgi:hypothetical protein
MNVRTIFILAIASFGGVAFAAPSPDPNPAARDGLVPVQTRNLDELYLRPRSDLASYRKVIIDPVQVAFDKNWMRKMNDTRDTTLWVSEDDARRIAAEMASSLGSIVADEFKARGYEIVAAPGPGVLRLTPSAVDLFVNAPDARPPGNTKTFTRDAGQATLVLEARDSVTGTILGRAVDRRRAQETRNTLTRATGVSNSFWFDTMFRRWAANCVKAFESGGDRARISSRISSLSATQT